MTVKEKRTIPLLRPEAPLPVKTAVILLALVWLRQMVFFVPEFLNGFRQGFSASRPEMVGTATLGGYLALNATLMIAMAHQKNWARTMQILSTLAEFLVIAWSLTFTDFKPGIVYFSDVVAVMLLLRPSVGAWFKRRPS
jgi:cation transport ATPase